MTDLRRHGRNFVDLHTREGRNKMFTWIDMMIVALVAAAFAAFVILFLLGSTLQEREGQAYQEGYYKGYRDRTVLRTNGDKIRAMTDEELGMVIMCPYDTAGPAEEIMPCIKEVDGDAPTQKNCYECSRAWLKKEMQWGK